MLYRNDIYLSIPSVSSIAMALIVKSLRRVSSSIGVGQMIGTEAGLQRVNTPLSCFTPLSPANLYDIPSELFWPWLAHVYFIPIRQFDSGGEILSEVIHLPI